MLLRINYTITIKLQKISQRFIYKKKKSNHQFNNKEEKSGCSCLNYSKKIILYQTVSDSKI
jgi:hypothetical protein